jgi:glycosyltransferase involved in cell wall biosynthesis
MYKTLHITNNDHDGAGLAVIRLHNALLNKGAKSSVLVVTKKNENLNVYQIGYSKSKKRFFIDLLTLRFLFNITELQDFIFFLKSKIIDKIFKIIYRPTSLFNFNYETSLYKNIKKYLKDYDVIVLYSIQGMLLPKDIAKIYKEFNKKIIFRPLDMEPLTGGCHFNFECTGWKDSCISCPQIGVQSKREISAKILNEKTNIYKDIPIHWMACNSYVNDRIKTSQILSSKHQVSTLFLGVHPNRYNYINSSGARDVLKLPQTKKIILFGCSDLQDKRKGAILLKQILQKQFSKKDTSNVCLVTFGETNGFNFDNIDITWIHLGTLTTDYHMNALYRSADLFVSPSLDDLGPVTMVEAFVNRLPIISFDVGIARDIVINDINGNIAKNFDLEDFGALMKRNVYSSNKDYIDNPKIQKSYNKFLIDSEASSFLKSLNYVL